MNISDLQEIIDNGDMFLVEKLSGLSKQDLYNYLVTVDKSIDNGSLHIKDFSRSSSFRALSETKKIVEAFIELREMKENRNKTDETNGFVIG